MIAPAFFQKRLIVGRGRQFDACLFVRDHDEPPVLQVLGRRGLPGRFEDGLQLLGLDGLVFIVTARVPRLAIASLTFMTNLSGILSFCNGDVRICHVSGRI